MAKTDLTAWATTKGAKAPKKSERPKYTEDEERELLEGPLGLQAFDLMYAMLDHLDAVALDIRGDDALDPEVRAQMVKLADGLVLLHFETIVDSLFNGGALDGDPDVEAAMEKNKIFSDETKRRDIVNWLASLSGDE